MHKILFALSLLFPILPFTAVAAEINMRPGLWQVETTSDWLLLAPYIPPEQMKGIENLAKEYGLEMPQIENGAAVSQVCITQKMATQKKLPNFYQEELGCVTKNATRNGNHYRTDFTCNSNDLKGTGTATGTITSPERFTGDTTFKGYAQGAPINETADVDGKWLNASCGKVSPL